MGKRKNLIPEGSLCRSCGIPAFSVSKGKGREVTKVCGLTETVVSETIVENCQHYVADIRRYRSEDTESEVYTCPKCNSHDITVAPVGSGDKVYQNATCGSCRFEWLLD